MESLAHNELNKTQVVPGGMQDSEVEIWHKFLFQEYLIVSVYLSQWKSLGLCIVQ